MNAGPTDPDANDATETLWGRVWEAHRPDMAPRSIYATDPYRMVEKRFAPDYVDQTETLFTCSNGFLGVRGCFDESRPSYQRDTLLNGFHETWPIVYGEAAYGFAKTGQTIVPVPDGTLIKLYVDDEPFEVPRAEVLEWERIFCMRTGALYRTVVWEMPTGKRLRLHSRRLVSLEHRHILMIDYEVEALDEPALLTISSELVSHHPAADDRRPGRGDPRRARSFDGSVLSPVDWRQGPERVAMSLATESSGMTVACGMQHVVTTVDCDYTRHIVGTGDHARDVMQVHARPGQPMHFTKWVAYHMSERTKSDELLFRTDLSLDRVLELGPDEMERQQTERVSQFWEHSDVTIEGADQLQQAVRFNLFHVFQASFRADNHGIPAKGLTGTGYEGHYFWDTEIYVMPFLTYTSPKKARNALQFRARMLDKARARAAELGHPGAMYPWRTINGEEASAYYAAGTAAYHINADIVYAIEQYVRATGDLGFLTDHGAEMMVETARLWYGLGFFSDRRDGQFCINGVTGPDEYSTVVDNNLFTNLMARNNLLAAADVVEVLRQRSNDDIGVLRHNTGLRRGEPDDWRRAGEQMYVPYDEQADVHLQDDAFLEKEVWDFEGTPPEHHPLLLHFHPLEIYRHQVIKQADVVLATFLAGWNFTYDQKRRVFEYYDPLTTGDSSLSACMQGVMAAELGLMEKAATYLADAVLVDLVDLAGNVRDGLHVASAGGVWIALVQGFGGMRDHQAELSFQPVIPEGWTRLRFRVRRRQSTIEVDITPADVTYRLVDGPGTLVTHWDREVTLHPDMPVTVANPSQAEVPRLTGDQIEEPPTRNIE